MDQNSRDKRRIKIKQCNFERLVLGFFEANFAIERAYRGFLQIYKTCAFMRRSKLR